MTIENSHQSIKRSQSATNESTGVLREISRDELNAKLDKHIEWLPRKQKEIEEKGSFSVAGQANLSWTNLEGKDLAGRNLQDACLDSANLRDARLNGADLSGAELGLADLSGANLNFTQRLDGSSSVTNLSGAILSQAKLIKAGLWYANLSGALLYQADLRGAHLNFANLSEADLRLVDLRDADLSDAVLLGADLTGADLKGTNLTRAKLSGAKLDGARFTRANLTNAVLSGGLSKRLASRRNPAHFTFAPSVEWSDGGHEQGDVDRYKQGAALPDATVARTGFGLSDLTGTKVPESLKNFEDVLKSVEDTSKNARVIYFSVLVLCAFALLTVATTTDAQLLADSIRLKLPIVNVEVSVSLFYLAAPLIGLLIYFYLHMYLEHLWNLIARLPSTFTDGSPLQEKVYPWMLNLLVEHWQADPPKGLSNRLKRGFRFSSIRAWTAALLGWGLLPVTIAAMGIRLLPRADQVAVYATAGFFILSVAVAAITYRRAKVKCRCEDDHRFHDDPPTLKHRLVPFTVTVLAATAAIFTVHFGLKGELPGTRLNLVRADLSDIVLPEISFRGAELRGARFEGADLSKVTGLTKDQLAGACGDDRTKLPEYLDFKLRPCR